MTGKRSVRPVKGPGRAAPTRRAYGLHSREIPMLSLLEPETRCFAGSSYALLDTAEQCLQRLCKSICLCRRNRDRQFGKANSFRQHAGVRPLQSGVQLARELTRRGVQDVWFATDEPRRGDIEAISASFASLGEVTPELSALTYDDETYRAVTGPSRFRSHRDQIKARLPARPVLREVPATRCRGGQGAPGRHGR